MMKFYMNILNMMGNFFFRCGLFKIYLSENECLNAGPLRSVVIFYCEIFIIFYLLVNFKEYGKKQIQQPEFNATHPTSVVLLWKKGLTFIFLEERI